MEESAKETKEEPIKDSPKQTNQPGKPKLTKKHFVITIVVYTLVLILAVVSVYLWQRNTLNNKTTQLESEKSKLSDEIASQSSQIESLKNQNSSLESRVIFLEKSLREATASAQFEFGELTIGSAKARHFTSDGGTEIVLVDVSMRNDTDQTLFLSASSFKLKDSNNKSYPQTSLAAFALPSGTTLLFDQQMAAGEVVTGTVAFDAPETINLFTLFYNDLQSTITIK